MSIYLAAPSINNPTATMNGQRIPHEDHLNRLAIGGFVVIGVLFAIFICFYIFSSLRDRPPAEYKSKESKARTAVSSDTEAGADMDPTEKSTLLAWMHRRSRGRFVDITGSPHPGPQIPRPPQLEPRSHGKRVNSFFSRISAVPNLVPSLPPPVFSTQAPVITCDASDTSSKTPTKHPFFPEYRLSFRSKSVLPISEEATTTNALPDRGSMGGLGYPIDDTTKTSCCTLNDSLHPSWIPRIPSPSKAVLIDKARDHGSLLRNEDTPPSEVIAKSGTIQQQFLNSRARVAGESDPF